MSGQCVALSLMATICVSRYAMEPQKTEEGSDRQAKNIKNRYYSRQIVLAVNEIVEGTSLRK